MGKNLRDLPDHELREQVRLGLDELVTSLLVAAQAAHQASIHLTLEAPENSAALGVELDVAGTRLGRCNEGHRMATAAWETILHRAHPKLKKGKKKRKS